MAESSTPALLLEACIREMGACLSSVTTLHCHIIDSSGSASVAAVMADSMSMLAKACPALQHLVLTRSLPATSLAILGSACPLLTTLTLQPLGKKIACVETFLIRALPKLSTLIPRLSHLAILGLPFQTEAHADLLKGVSQCKGITSLDLRDVNFCDHTYWHYLPPQLQQLRCKALTAGPTRLNGHTSLISLWTTGGTSIGTLAQLLRAAPVLKNYHQGLGPDQLKLANTHLSLVCKATLAADLTLLNTRQEEGLCIDTNVVFVLG